MKSKYRYNWTTEKWDELFRFNTDIYVIGRSVRPDGSLNTFKIPRESPLVNYYLNKGVNH